MKVYNIKRWRRIRRSAYAAAIVVTGAGAGLWYHLNADETISPDSIIKIPPLNPSIKPRPLEAGDFVYQNDAQNHRNLIIKREDGQTFFAEWMDLARENCKTTGAKITCDGSSYADWQEARQSKYLQKMKDLSKRIMDTCLAVFKQTGNQSDLNDCTKNTDKDEVEELNRNYIASDALRLWQLQHIEYGYVTALMDPQVRKAVYNWDNLWTKQKLTLERRLDIYQAAAYADITRDQNLPKVEATHLPPGKEGVTRGGAGDIAISIDSLQRDGVASNLETFRHEGHHSMIQGGMRELVKTEAGRKYLLDQGLLTESQIITIGLLIYSSPDKDPTAMMSSPTNKAYTHEAIEAGVGVDEATGGELASAILSKDVSHPWTVEEGQASFRHGLDGLKLDHTDGPYADVGKLAYKLEYEQAWHEVFLSTYLNGGQVCIMSPARLTQNETTPKVECKPLAFTRS